MNGSLIVVSPDWPGSLGGAALCTRSDLRILTRFFPRIFLLYVGPERRSYELLDPAFGEIEVARLPRSRRAGMAELLRAMSSRLPVVAHRYVQLGSDIEKALLSIRDPLGDPISLMFCDVPTAVLESRIRRVLPVARVAIRSQNVLSNAFRGLERGRPLESWLWRVELSKLQRFERQTVRCADRLWAITQGEADEYRRLGADCNGVWSVGIDHGRYRHVPSGDNRTVLHIGRLDLRKGRGLRDFLRHSWPKVLSREPSARLVLAGQGSTNFADPRRRVYSDGLVTDDRELLAGGPIFVNPQQVGAGLQIKNVVAMLAGKAVVTTLMAAEGLGGESGRHYLVAGDSLSMVESLTELLGNPARVRTLGEAARALASERFDPERVAEEALVLLGDFVTVS